MDHSQCVAWLSNRSSKVARIDVIRAAMFYDMIASASPITSTAMKFEPRGGWTFQCVDLQDVCTIAEPLPGDLGDIRVELVSLASVARFESSGSRLSMSMSVIAEVFLER